MANPVRIALAFLLAMGVTAIPATAETLLFDITRDGQPFGRHIITILSNGVQTDVENAADAKVAWGPVTVFRYAYNSREVWENGRLRRMSTWTNDDGKEISITAEATKDGLKVVGPDGQSLLPNTVLPTSFWTIEVARNSVLLDTQTGQLAKVTSQFEGVEGEAGGKLYRYRLSGDINTELWYDVRGLLAKARFNARGSVFEFSRPPEATQISSETNSLKGGS